MKKKDVSAHVYITNSKIQVLMGSCVKNKLQVVNCYEEPLEEGCILNGIIMNNYSLQNTLTEMWQKYNLPTKGVTLVVNGSSITVKPLKVPQIAPKNVPGFIRGELRDIEGIQNMLVDYSVVTPKNPDGSIDYSKDFFGKQTSLTVSGQLEAECMAMAFGKVYTFGPTFRAERSYTQRHAAEFWMVEPEIAFADLNDDMDLMEAMIKYIIKDVMARCPQDIDFFNQFVDKGLKERLEHVANSDFVRISYTDAVKLLEKNNDNFEYKVSWGCDLQTEHERYLTEKEFGKPVFVTDYPKEIKAFYMRLNDDDKTVAATDLLVPGIGELCGASQREERYDVLRAHGHVPYGHLQYPRRTAVPAHNGLCGVLNFIKASLLPVQFAVPVFALLYICQNERKSRKTRRTIVQNGKKCKIYK